MLVLQSAVPGLRSLSQSFTIAGDIAIGCVFALIAGLTAYLFALWILRPTLSSDIPRSPLAGRLSLPPRWTPWGKGGAACLILPGLFGSLVLGLTILALFQLPLLHMAYDTPIPWVVASVLFLLPRAAVFLFLLAAVTPRESSHAAELLQLSPRPRQKRHALELLWQTRLAMHFWAVVVLCYWAYVDLTTAAILSPTTMVSAPVRLYNLMHYGQSAVLSAMVFATFAIPAIGVFSLILLTPALDAIRCLMNDCLWKLDGVTLDGDRRPRLREIGLSIHAGHTAVVGPSGAGKTSLLNLLVEFETPSRGVIQRATFSEDRLPTFWVPASGGLWPHLSVREHLQFVAPESKTREEFESILKQFDLAEKAHAYPDALSDGERTRLAIARALAADAAVLVMDEPLANVDVTRAYHYWRAIRSYCAADGHLTSVRLPLGGNRATRSQPRRLPFRGQCDLRRRFARSLSPANQPRLGGGARSGKLVQRSRRSTTLVSRCQT